MDSESLEESFLKALPPPSSSYSRKISQESTMVSAAENIPQGLVKGYGGAIEKSIAAHAANSGSKSRGAVPKPLTPSNTSKTQEKAKLSVDSEDGDQVSKSSDDSCSLADLDRVLVHNWFMALMRNEAETVRTMAKQEPKLVQVRDFIAGYTAAHWAAHHGNSDLLVFLCRNFEINKAARTRAGYTPLHVAYIHQKANTADVLTNVLDFDVEERDYSGRTPPFYIRSAVVCNDLNPSSCTSSSGQKKTISKALNTGLRRIGSLNAKFRSSMMRQRNPAFTSLIRESKSSPICSLTEERGVHVMPPPVTVPKVRSRLGSDIFRRGSQVSDMSRSDSVISIDDTKSFSSGKALLDSGSDSASFHESESMDSFHRSDPTSSGSLTGEKSSNGKTASPLIYTKTLNFYDDGSQV